MNNVYVAFIASLDMICVGLSLEQFKLRNLWKIFGLTIPIATIIACLAYTGISVVTDTYESIFRIISDGLLMSIAIKIILSKKQQQLEAETIIHWHIAIMIDAGMTAIAASVSEGSMIAGIFVGIFHIILTLLGIGVGRGIKNLANKKLDTIWLSRTFGVILLTYCVARVISDVLKVLRIPSPLW